MKRFHLFFLLITAICPISSFEQTTFNKIYHFDFPNIFFNGVVATDSCYYVKATFNDTLVPTRLGILLAKLNLEGDLEFSKTIKHPDRLYSNDFCNLLNGNDGFLYEVALVGDSVSRAILIKYTHDGDTILTKEYYSILYPALQYFVPRVIRQNPNDGFALLFGHESIPLSDFDISLLLLDSGYNIQQYKKLATTPQQETATALILDNDGGYIIGADRSNLNLVSENFTSRTLVVKTDSIGNSVWQWLSPSGVLQGAAEAMFKTTDGGLVVASKEGFEVVVNQNDGIIYWDALVFKLDADKNEVWRTPLRGSHPGPSTELVEMVEAIDGSGYVVTGIVADSVSGPEPTFGCWLAKVSSEGDSIWARYYSWIDGVKIRPEPWSLAATPDGGYVAVGTCLNVLEPTIPGWVLKLDEYGCLVPGCHLPNITMEEGMSTVQLSIYPNPTSDYLNFYIHVLNPAIKTTFRIINAEGKLAKEIKTDNLSSTFIVPIWGLADGTYILQCLSEGNIIASSKFIISK